MRGKVVVVDFCTYTCINWLRSLPYVRAWAEATIRPDGTDLTQLTFTGAPTSEWAPAWSPDGSRIAYAVVNWRRG